MLKYFSKKIGYKNKQNNLKQQKTNRIKQNPTKYQTGEFT